MYRTSHKHDIVHDSSIIKHLLLSCFVSTVRSERECGLAALLQKNHPQWLWPTNTIFSVTLTRVPLLFKTTDGTQDVNSRLWCQRVHHPPRPPPCGSETRLHSLIKKNKIKKFSLSFIQPGIISSQCNWQKQFAKLQTLFQEDRVEICSAYTSVPAPSESTPGGGVLCCVVW